MPILLVFCFFIFFSSQAHALDLSQLQKPGQYADIVQNSSAQTDSAECTDDERLLEIDQWIGKGPMKPLVTVTPEYFMEMNESVRESISSGQMMICPNIPVLKKGIPSKKVEVPFPLILEKINEAITDNNSESIKILKRSYKASAIPAKDIVNLALDKVIKGKENCEFVSKNLGISMLDRWKSISALQLYITFGGKCLKNEYVYNGDTNDVHNECKKKFKNCHMVGRIYSDIGGYNLPENIKDIGGLLTKAGLTVLYDSDIK